MSIKICSNCKNKFSSKFNGSKYCSECLNKRIECFCGCGNYLKEGLFLKGINYLKGHGRKNKITSEEHKFKIGLGNRGKIRSDECIEQNRLRNIGRIHSKETREKISKIATEKGFGKWMNEKWKNSNSIFNSKEYRQKLSLSLKGHNTTQETKNKISLKNSGKNNGFFGKHHNKISLEIISLTSKKYWEQPGKKENQRQKLLNGQAAKMLKFIKNPSKPEIKLRNIVKELYPEAEFQCTVFNYSLDVALKDKKIAIEYDGYYHFKSKEDIEYHKKRQEKIEDEGWKFLRYTMFDKFPSKEQVREDVEKILEFNED